MVRSSSVVLPAPGELVTLNARMPRSASHCRFCSAIRSFFARTFCSREIVSVWTWSSWWWGVVMVVRVVMVMREMAGQRDDGTVVAAAAGCAHDQLTSIDRIRSSRPASTSTSALPHGHNRIKSVQFELLATAAAARRAGPHVEVQASTVGHGALGGQLEAELHRVGNDRAQRADLHLDALHATSRGVLAHRVDNTLRHRHLVHMPRFRPDHLTIGRVRVERRAALGGARG